ncbi:MAG: type II secretion system protein [Planctomycetota bacterium]
MSPPLQQRDRAPTPPIDRAVGVVMLAHVVGLAALKLARGLEGEMLWISHVALALGGLALIVRSTRLAAMAFVGVAALHTLWLLDAAMGVATGRFPLGLTAYLLEADAWTLLGTSHHLYLTPMLAVWLRGRRVEPGRAAFHAAALFALLALACRLLLPAHLNVDFAHALLPQADSAVLAWVNALAAPAFLAVLTLGAATLFFLPGALVLARLGHVAPRQRVRRAPIRRASTRLARAFTLIELIAVIVVLAVLAGVALPRYFDYADRAEDSATAGSVGGIQTALSQVFINNQANNASAGDRITNTSQIAGTMQTGRLPEGVTINSAGRLLMPNGDQYAFTAETDSSPARITRFVGGGGS